MDTKTLSGKTIYRLFVKKDGSSVRIDTDAGPFILDAEGDCCSISYFSEIYGGGKDLSERGPTSKIEEMELGEAAPRLEHTPDYGRTLIYGIRIRFEDESKENILLIFRNDSNGFYGGSVETRQATEADTLAEVWKTVESSWDYDA